MFQWSDYARKGAGHTTAQGGISFGGSIVFLDGETLTNQGTALLANQKLQLLDKATFVNAAGALLDIHDDALINVADGSSAAIQNAGTLRKSGGTDTTAIYPAFNNTGIVDVETGELELIGNETGNGTFNVNAPGQLAFVNRVGETGATLAPGAVVMGSGTVLFVNGVFSLDATHYHPANTKIDEACVNLSGDRTLDNLDIEGAGYGILDVSGSLTIAKTFRWNGTLQGSGQTIVQGKTTIGDGQDAWLKGHRLTLQGGAQYGQDPSTTAALYTASIFMTDKATLTNAAGSTFDCRCNGSIHNQGGDASRSSTREHSRNHTDRIPRPSPLSPTIPASLRPTAAHSHLRVSRPLTARRRWSWDPSQLFP